MIFIWGSRLYGKVDDANGVFHVATKFAHLWFIPLFPVGSSVAIVERTGDSYRGAPISLSGKSVLAAYLRAWTILATIVFGLVGLAHLSPGSRSSDVLTGVVCLVLAAGSLALCIWAFVSPKLGKASYERASEIAAKLGMSDEGRVLLQLAYELITPEEAAAAMVQIQAHRAEMEQLTKPPVSHASPLPPLPLARATQTPPPLPPLPMAPGRRA